LSTTSASAVRPVLFVPALLVLLVAVGQWVAESVTGATVGNAVTGIRTVSNRTGRPAGLLAILVRQLVVAVGALVCFVGEWVVVVSGTWDKTPAQRGWHDKAAGTLVLRARSVPRPRSSVPDTAWNTAVARTMGDRPAPDPGLVAAPPTPQPVLVPAPPAAEPGLVPAPPVPGPGHVPAPPGLAAARGPVPTAESMLAPEAPGLAAATVPVPSAEPVLAPEPPTAPAPVSEAADVATGSEPAEEFLVPLVPVRRVPDPPTTRREARRADAGASGVVTGMPGIAPEAEAPAARAQPVIDVPAAPPGVPSAPSDLGELEHTRLRPSAPAPAAPAPVALRLRFDTGERVDVTGDGLVGRSPSAEEGVAHVVPVDDPARSISKTHLAFGLDGAGDRLWVMDRGSTNGTVLVAPDETSSALPAGTRATVAAGWTIRFGQRSAVVERR